MSEKLSIVILWSLVATCLPKALAIGGESPDVIYGQDNRKDLYQLSAGESRFKDLAASTALLTSLSGVSESPVPNLMELSTQTHQEKNRVCADEPYASQPVGGWCSGFLVGPDLLATAGHCVVSESRCSQTAVIFGYSMQRSNSSPQFALNQNVYRCREIVARSYQPPRGLDYALIRLDRAVTDRRPLTVRSSGRISDSEQLTIIGHPSGLPTKVAAGAIVRENSDENFFVSNTDSYGGNSGSPVFNSRGLVEGILVRGETDYEYRGDCLMSKRCGDSECRGEDITRTTAFVDKISPAP